MIQESAGTSWKEMYQVFNMGQRLEMFTDKDTAAALVALAKEFNIDAQISGYVEESEIKEVVIESEHGVFHYS
jgi:phosphoribosylformylglycinamidine cyclo-ligase